jgi:tRNA(Ser,Leu) C12 N-acetylase TAN1
MSAEPVAFDASMPSTSTWNVVVTLVPGPHHFSDVLGALARFGRFSPTAFKDVCVGQVSDVRAMLEAIARARTLEKSWGLAVGHVVPVELTFSFEPDRLTEEAGEQLQQLWDRVPEGSMWVRVKRRGLAGQVHSQQVEQALADQVMTLAERTGKKLSVSLADPDCTIVIETLDTVAGIGLITREQRERYPFTAVK